jgi:hypothetical protein
MNERANRFSRLLSIFIAAESFASGDLPIACGPDVNNLLLPSLAVELCGELMTRHFREFAVRAGLLELTTKPDLRFYPGYLYASALHISGG